MKNSLKYFLPGKLVQHGRTTNTMRKSPWLRSLSLMGAITHCHFFASPSLADLTVCTQHLQTPPIFVGTATDSYMMPNTVFLGGGKWSAVKEYESLFRQSRTYNLYDRLGRPVGSQVTSGTLAAEDANDPLILPITPSLSGTALLLAVSGLRLPQPAQPATSEPYTATDHAAVVLFLRSLNVPVHYPKLQATIIADLDGDGTKERLINGECGRSDMSGRAFNSSEFVLLVTRSGGIHSLAYELVRSGDATEVSRHSIVSVADVDGDGTREVAVARGYLDGWDMRLFSWRGNKVVPLLGGSSWNSGSRNVTVKPVGTAKPAGSAKKPIQAKTPEEAMEMMGDAYRLRDSAMLANLISPKGLRVYDEAEKKVIVRISFNQLKSDLTRRKGWYEFLFTTQGDRDPGGGWWFDIFSEAKYYNWEQVKPGRFRLLRSDETYQYIEFEKVNGSWKLAELGMYFP